MNFGDLLGAVFLCAFVWFWYDSTRARELAMSAVRRACEHHGQLLLDETVSLMRIRPRWAANGRLLWWRCYDFEFTTDGEQRNPGQVEIHGRRVVSLYLSLPDYGFYDLH